MMPPSCALAWPARWNAKGHDIVGLAHDAPSMEAEVAAFRFRRHRRVDHRCPMPPNFSDDGARACAKTS